MSGNGYMLVQNLRDFIIVPALGLTVHSPSSLLPSLSIPHVIAAWLRSEERKREGGSD